jgi:hypothetical protein
MHAKTKSLHVRPHPAAHDSQYSFTSAYSTSQALPHASAAGLCVQAPALSPTVQTVWRDRRVIQSSLYMSSQSVSSTTDQSLTVCPDSCTDTDSAQGCYTVRALNPAAAVLRSSARRRCCRHSSSSSCHPQQLVCQLRAAAAASAGSQQWSRSSCCHCCHKLSWLHATSLNLTHQGLNGVGPATWQSNTQTDRETDRQTKLTEFWSA